MKSKSWLLWVGYYNPCNLCQRTRKMNGFFKKYICCEYKFRISAVLTMVSKTLNLEPKMPHFGIFRLKFEKAVITFDITILKFAMRKVLCKNKTPEIWDKNELCESFWAAILKAIVIFEISILLLSCKVLCKNETKFKFETKKDLFGNFCAAETGILKFFKNYFLTNALNFGTGSVLSKDPWSPFCEDPCVKYVEP